MRMVRWLPAYRTLRGYRAGWLRHDVVAGVSLAAVMIPAGMGYAIASGLPPITGLYATVIPLVVYAIFGPSRILVFGPDSALVPLIATTILPLAGGQASRAVALAGALGLLTGIICAGAAIARLGLVSDFLSGPVRHGYVNGLALTILAAQLPKLFGFSVSGLGVLQDLAGFAGGLGHGRTVVSALAIGMVALGLVLACRIWAPRVPAVLIAVILSIVAVEVFGLSRDLQTVGVVPGGLPGPALPAINLGDLVQLIPAALAIALLAFTDTAVVSRTFAARGAYEVDSNQELFALGLVNAAAGLFQGFPISCSGTRTPVAESTGAKTQMAGLVAAVVIVLLLFLGPGLVRDLPMATLAAVVIAAAIGLFQVKGVARLYKVDRPEFALSVVSLLGVVVLGVLPGIAVAVALSLLDFVRHAWRPHDAVLGRVQGLKGYHDLARHSDARQVPGLLLFRWDAPLFFANAGLFRERVRALVIAPEPRVRWIVIASEPITDIDSTAFEVLKSLQLELRTSGIELAFAEMKGPVKDRLRLYGMTGAQFFPTVGVAVKEYVRETGVQWKDWQEA
jgi:high affinity sulfate transporter 1